MGLYTKYVESYPDIKKYWNESSDELRQVFGNSLEEFGKWHWQKHGKGENRSITGSTTLPSSHKVPSFGDPPSTPSNQTYGPLTTQDRIPQDVANKLSELQNQLTAYETAAAKTDAQLAAFQTSSAEEKKLLQDQLKIYQETAAAEQKTLQEAFAEQLEAYKTTSAEEQTALQEKYDEQLKAYQTTSAEEQKTLQESFAEQLKAYETSAAEERALLEEQYGEQLKTYQTTSAEERAALQKGFTKQLEAYQTKAAEDQALLQEQYGKQLEAYQTASEEREAALRSEFALQNKLNREESRRQMLIGLQSKSKGPAPVRTAASTAQQQGLTTRGSTGYFGRQGLRIGSLNVPTTGLTISSGVQPSKTSTPGSFN